MTGFDVRFQASFGFLRFPTDGTQVADFGQVNHADVIFKSLFGGFVESAQIAGVGFVPLNMTQQFRSVSEIFRASETTVSLLQVVELRVIHKNVVVLESPSAIKTRENRCWCEFILVGWEMLLHFFVHQGLERTQCTRERLQFGVVQLLNIFVVNEFVESERRSGFEFNMTNVAFHRFVVGVLMFDHMHVVRPLLSEFGRAEVAFENP